jgi:hypothetical protein
MKYYRSAISPILATVIGLSWILLLVMNILSKDILAMLLLSSVGLFFTYMYLSTTYTIGEGELHVRSGFVLKERIEITKITRISRATDFLAAPAFSFDRLVIRYGNNRSILISPKGRKAFLDDLVTINPAIAIDDKAVA